MARVKVVINQKGGVGKSTLAVNLGAVESNEAAHAAAGSAKSPVLVVSVDPQGSATWWTDRVRSTPFRIAQAHDDVESLRRLHAVAGVDHVIVDTPGWIGDSPGDDRNGGSGEALDAVLSIADLAVVPMLPEALSFDPTARTVRQVLEPRGIPFVVVVNAWDPRDGRTDLLETCDFVRSQGWPLARTVVRRYKIHTRASAEGVLVTEYPRTRAGSHARDDIQRLALELSMGVRSDGS